MCLAGEDEGTLAIQPPSHFIHYKGVCSPDTKSLGGKVGLTQNPAMYRELGVVWSPEPSL